MKNVITAVLFILTAHTAYPQDIAMQRNPYANIDKKALQIPERFAKDAGALAGRIMSEFESEEDRLRAAFIWVASNIEYDVRNVNKPVYTERREMIDNALRTRKALCGGYSALFSELCTSMGMKCYEIDGYTMFEGTLADIGHAWCAVRVGNQWRLFDPTWAAGVIYKGKFIKRINNAYYKASPDAFIRTHMPYDHLWQLLYHPVTNAEFTSGNSAENRNRPYFNYPDSLQVYDRQTSLERLTAAEARIEKNGVTNGLIAEKLRAVRHNIEYEKSVIAVDLYNAAVIDFNAAVDLMNGFITFWNNRFRPAKPDEEIREMLEGVSAKLAGAKEKLLRAENAGASDVNASDMNTRQFGAEIKAMEERTAKVRDWLETYLKKGKLGRSGMFSGYYGNPFD